MTEKLTLDRSLRKGFRPKTTNKEEERAQRNYRIRKWKSYRFKKSYKNGSLHNSKIFSWKAAAAAAIVIKKKCIETAFSHLFLRKNLYEESWREEFLPASCSAFIIFVFSVYHKKQVLQRKKYNPSARAGYDTRSIFKRSLTGLYSEFSFS